MNLHEKIARLADKLKREKEIRSRCRMVCKGRPLAEVVELVERATSAQRRPVFERLVGELLGVAEALPAEATAEETDAAIWQHPHSGIWYWFWALQAGDCSLPERLPDEIIQRFASDGELGCTNVRQLCVECRLALPSGRTDTPAPQERWKPWQSCPHCGGEVRYLKLWVTDRCEVEE
jgi:hypothetical protein